MLYLTGFSILFDMNFFKALLDQWTLLVTLFLTATLFSLVAANFGEEIGWRGFAMPRVGRPMVTILAYFYVTGYPWSTPAEGNPCDVSWCGESNNYQVTDELPVDYFTWSPDSRLIVLSGVLFNADGSGGQNLSVRFAQDGPHSWAPDGHRLVFFRKLEGHSDLYIVTVSH